MLDYFRLSAKGEQAMVGKMRMVVFLTLLVMSMVGAVQADTVFPLQVGYTATYQGTWAGTPSPYTATLQITGTVSGDPQSFIMEEYNWVGDGYTGTINVGANSTAFYMTGSESNPIFETGAGAGTTWTTSDGRDAKIMDIVTWTVPAGQFNNVYVVLLDYDKSQGQQTLSYWVPGVGLIEQYDYIYQNQGPRTLVLTSYATPLPPSLVLFGSALAGLIGFRRLRRS